MELRLLVEKTVVSAYGRPLMGNRDICLWLKKSTLNPVKSCRDFKIKKNDFWQLQK